MNDKRTAKWLAEQAQAFRDSDFGQYYLEQLGLHYNALHQQAEDESLGVNSKAMRIERAAGVKWAINLITTKTKLLEEGYIGKND